MPRSSRENPKVRSFILEHVADHPASVAVRAAKTFGLSRAAISGYMRRLVAKGLLEAQGRTAARRYKLKPLKSVTFSIELSPGLPEDVVWRFRVLPQLAGVRQNVIDICQYGFTEILNNAIDHSVSPYAAISYIQTAVNIRMSITDSGVGIFQKIMRDFGLSDPREALLELSKGKLTSNKLAHSGEGIFFSSRMFDEFSILSGNLFYRKTRKDDDEWLIETEDRKTYTQGTHVAMEIAMNADWTTRQVFDRFQGDHPGFRKTRVPIMLGRYPGEQLVSRSQAKRILARFQEFSEVLLDFRGVREVGLPFTDEIFRVFHNAHPETSVLAINTSAAIDRMIAHVRAEGPAQTKKV